LRLVETDSGDTLSGLDAQLWSHFEEVMRRPGQPVEYRDTKLELIAEQGRLKDYFFMDAGSFMQVAMDATGPGAFIRKMISKVTGQRAPNDLSGAYLMSAADTADGPDITNDQMYGQFRDHLERQEESYRQEPLNLEGTVMRRVNAQDIVLHVKAKGANFSYANLWGSRVQGDLSGTDLSYAIISHMPESNLSGANLEGAQIKADRACGVANLYKSDFTNANMRDMSIDTTASFYEATFDGTDLRGSVLELARTQDADSIALMRDVKILPEEEFMMRQLMRGKSNWSYELGPNEPDPGEQMTHLGGSKPLEVMAEQYAA